ncbi:hypothetical protein OPT61_g5648 [Boeremia exigua]|uniref:Uncharacterized protein n=1 Tax=Boeremia exigua TaxID=749465 RepID=A0ACC2I9P2_9PLEO|nr:hypothetical protein OPT61_g5648 [Boeremia exigua]
MAAAEYYSGACMDMVPKHLLAPHMLWRAQTEQTGRREDENSVIQGQIMWLPAFDDLPERAVRRAHGKGAVEEGIYNHPVVVVSRPMDDNKSAHFHLITSLQGKKLDQLYPKSNEFHTSRRSWYLPISPSPDHPDASSKKAKKRFPTLMLADGATLRWDSYVNIRHVYKIDWNLLKPYSNLNNPRTTLFRLDRESTVRMIAKGKILTLYEPSEQLPTLGVQTRRTAPSRLLTSTASRNEQCEYESNSPGSEDESVASPVARQTPSLHEPDPQASSRDGHRTTELSSGQRLDAKSKPSFLGRVLGRFFPRRRKG